MLPEEEQFSDEEEEVPNCFDPEPDPHATHNIIFVLNFEPIFESTELVLHHVLRLKDENTFMLEQCIFPNITPAVTIYFKGFKVSRTMRRSAFHSCYLFILTFPINSFAFVSALSDNYSILSPQLVQMHRKGWDAVIELLFNNRFLFIVSQLLYNRS